MATYKEIKGVTIQALDEDPVEFVGTWASGGNLNTARGNGLGGAGIQTAALAFAGAEHLIVRKQNLIMEVLGRKPPT